MKFCFIKCLDYLIDNSMYVCVCMYNWAQLPMMLTCNGIFCWKFGLLVVLVDWENVRNGKKNKLFLILHDQKQCVSIYITSGLVWLLGRCGKRLHIVLYRLFRKRGTILFLKGLRDPLMISSLYKGKKVGKEKERLNIWILKLCFIKCLEQLIDSYMYTCMYNWA